MINTSPSGPAGPARSLAGVRPRDPARSHPAGYRLGMARHERRLADLQAGRRVAIASAGDAAARQRLTLYGLVEGAEVVVEKRGGNGDLIVLFDTARYYIPANLAHSIWVGPAPAS